MYLLMGSFPIILTLLLLNLFDWYYKRNEKKEGHASIQLNKSTWDNLWEHVLRLILLSCLKVFFHLTGQNNIYKIIRLCKVKFWCSIYTGYILAVIIVDSYLQRNLKHQWNIFFPPLSYRKVLVWKAMLSNFIGNILRLTVLYLLFMQLKT